MVGKDAGLGEAIHPFWNLVVHPSAFVLEVFGVAFDDFFRDDVEL